MFRRDRVSERRDRLRINYVKKKKIQRRMTFVCMSKGKTIKSKAAKETSRAFLGEEKKDWRQVIVAVFSDTKCDDRMMQVRDLTAACLHGLHGHESCVGTPFILFSFFL